ncbi:MAG TPA: carbohydrate ABC transporter permease [Clostridiales bacterium]|nr:carbohydrate ABC transporter permease [Clostridiales bacterium]
MDNRNVSPLTKVVIYLIMITFTVLTVYPIFWLVIQSFKTNTAYLTTNKLSLPVRWYTGNYPFVWIQGNFFTFFINSVIYSVVTVIAVVILSNMAGYAFAKIHFKITKLLHGLFIVGILLTLQSILIPLFLMVNAAGLYNTRWAVLIPYIALGLPMGVYLCTDFIKGIHDELLESAKIDGASFMKIFTRIVFPMCAPVSVTLAIITFTGSWNEFILMNLMTATDKYKAIPAAVGRYSGALGSDYGKLFTSLTVALIPIIVFYFIFRNQITKGVAAGAVKG